MRTLLACAVLTASFSCTVPATATDKLFSEVAMESVFEPHGNTVAETATMSADDTLPRITSTDSLLAALKSAGWEASKVGDSASIKLRQGRWTLPLSMTVKVEQDRIVTNVSLVKIDRSTVGHQPLLNLLAAGDAGRGVLFAYDPESKFIVLRSSFSNRSVTPSQLRKHLDELGTVAEQHADSWSPLGKGPQAPETAPQTGSAQQAGSAQQTGPVQTPGTATAGAPTDSFALRGSWTASVGTSSFAIRLTADSRFQLVHVNNGKSTISKGKVTRSGNRLTLLGDDGNQVQGTVVQTNPDRFQWSLAGRQGAAATELNFKRAK